MRLAAFQSLGRLGPSAQDAIPAFIFLSRNAGLGDSERVAVEQAVEQIDPQGHIREQFAEWDTFQTVPPVVRATLEQLRHWETSRISPLPSHAFELCIKGCYLDTTGSFYIGSIRDSFSRNALISLAGLVDSFERYQRAGAVLLFVLAGLDEERAATALSGLVSLRYAPATTAAAALSRIFDPRFGNISRERMLGSVIELCENERNPFLTGAVMEELRYWLLPEQEHRGTVEHTKDFYGRLLNDIRQTDGEIVFPNSNKRIDSDDVHVRASVVRTLGSLLSLEKTNDFRVIRALVDLARDPERLIREAAFLSLGMNAAGAASEVREIARQVVRERDFLAKRAGIWCLQRLESEVTTAEDRQGIRKASTLAAQSLREQLQKSSLPLYERAYDLILLDVLTHIGQLGFMTPSTRHVRALYVSTGQALQMPELCEKVQLAAVRLTPHLPEDPQFPAVEALTRIATDRDVYGASEADCNVGREVVRRLPEAETYLCRLIEHSDSATAIAQAFQSLRLDSNRFAVTLSAQNRPPIERRQFLGAVVEAALYEGERPVVDLLNCGWAHFGRDSSEFAKLWKESVLETLAERIRHPREGKVPKVGFAMELALSQYLKDSDVGVRDRASAVAKELGWDFLLVTKLVRFVQRQAFGSKATSAQTEGTAVYVPVSSGNSLTHADQRILEKLSSFDSPKKAVMIEAARVLIDEIPDSPAKKTALREILEVSPSIAVRSLVAEALEREAKRPRT